MTLYFPNDSYPTISGGFCIDGDLSGDSPFYTNTPQGWAQMRLQLISRYTNRSVDNNDTVDTDVIAIFIRDVNERYTEFGFTTTLDEDLQKVFVQPAARKHLLISRCVTVVEKRSEKGISKTG